MNIKQQLEAIRKINPDAAEYIENEVLPRYSAVGTNIEGRDIFDCFIWHLSPQGRDYWFNIWSKLNGN